LRKYEVLLSRTALRQWRVLDAQARVRISRALSELANDPRRSRPGADIRKLRGSGRPPLYRLRVGDYRIVYAMVGNAVKVTGLFHRRKGYDFLE